MPASKAEQVLEAIRALLETVPDAVVERNSVLPEKVPAGGLIILRDGDPGEPEQALGGFANAYYQHAVEIEVYVEEGDPAARDAAFDALLQQIGAASGPDPRRPRREGNSMSATPNLAIRGVCPRLRACSIVVSIARLLPWPPASTSAHSKGSRTR
jgi:hypothetical protein